MPTQCFQHDYATFSTLTMQHFMTMQHFQQCEKSHVIKCFVSIDQESSQPRDQQSQNDEIMTNQTL